MRIAVIGAGIVGVTTAHALAKDGHEVSVFERNTAVAEGASFSNGGLLAPSMTSPSAHPLWPTTGLMRWLKPARGYRIAGGVGLKELRWLLGWKHPAPETFARNFRAASALIEHSQQLFRAIAHEHGLTLESGTGQLVLLRSEADVAVWNDKLAALKEMGVAHSRLAPDQARVLEPALAVTQTFHAAIHFPNDVFANCRQFAQLLRDLATENGARFHFSTPVQTIAVGNPVQLTLADGSSHSFDHVILATGNAEPLLAAAGLPRGPLALMQSYSLNAPVREPLNAPRNAIHEWGTGVTMTRLGLRVRVTGGAELGRIRSQHHAATVRQLYQALQQHYPGACSFQSGTQVWKGATLHALDGLPAIGSTSMPGLWVNIAHGHNGWGMACASAEMLAAMLTGRAPALDPAPFAPNRWQ